jgi:hypothetical protein
MFWHERGQYADHHDVGSAGVGLAFGGVQASSDVGLEFQTGASRQRARWHVEFYVVGA